LIRFLAIRYLAYALIFLEILLAPQFLNKESYANYEYIKNLLNLCSFILLGSHTGYLVYVFSKKRDYFEALVRIALLILLICGIAVAVTQGSAFLILPVVCIGVSFIIEKKLQVVREFFLAILFKPLVSILLVLCLCIYSFVFKHIPITQVICFGYVLAMISWFILSKLFIKRNLVEFDILKRFSVLDFAKYRRLVSAGLTENLGTILLTASLFIDRYVLKTYFPAELASYSLAFNFSQFVFIGINSVSYIEAVNIGENFLTIGARQLKQIIKKSMMMFLLLLVGVMTLAVGYDRFFSAYTGFLGLVLILSALVGFFYASNVTSVILLYARKQYIATSILAATFCLNVLLSAVFIQARVAPVFLIIKSAGLLTIAGTLILIMSFREIKKRDAEIV
jgi:O-antigen/teichoic acid export membrane protein